MTVNAPFSAIGEILDPGQSAEATAVIGFPLTKGAIEMFTECPSDERSAEVLHEVQPTIEELSPPPLHTYEEVPQLNWLLVARSAIAGRWLRLLLQP